MHLTCMQKILFYKPQSQVCMKCNYLNFLKLNLISTLNPQFQLIADNLIESLQVSAIKLVITQLFPI